MRRVVVVERVELLADGGYLLDAVLVSREIGLERLVLLDQCLEVVELAALEVLGVEQLLLAVRPGLVYVALVLELLGQVVEALEAHELGEEPLLEALLGELEYLPRVRNVRHQLALARHVRRPVAQAQLGLQRVEVRLELGLLLEARRLLDAPIVAKLGQLGLRARQRVVGDARLQPRRHASYPLHELN